jgi:nickel-dependent lactate racemase
MEVNIEYANKVMPIRIPEKMHLTELKPGSLPIAASLTDTLMDALENPAGTMAFSDMLSYKQPKSIAIAVPNDTDSIPVKDILSYVLECIFKTLPLLAPSSVKIVVGSGHHSLLNGDLPNSVLASDLAHDCEVLVHNPTTTEMVDLDTTISGTPVRVNKGFAAAEFKICIGWIIPHQIIGFTGASEEVTIGCSATGTTENALALLLDDKACIGRLDGNPVREALNEVSRMVGLDFAIDIVLNENQKIVRLFAGHPEETLRQGSKICSAIWGVEVEHKFDIVIACCGDRSENKNDFHLEKQLNLISHIIQKGGKALLLTASQLGIGKDIYFDHICQEIDPDEVMVKFKKLEWQMGFRNAYFFGRMDTNFDIDLSFDSDIKILNDCHLRAADISTIIKEWADGYEKESTLAIIANTNIYIKQSAIDKNSIQADKINQTSKVIL